MMHYIKKTKNIGIDSFTLHLLAMLLMLCDHLWATLMLDQMWLTTIGRIAFPIFAFMLVEGYFHTKNIKKYFIRLLIGAIIAEIPFNLMYVGNMYYPYHQNVMWTFLIALFCLWATEKIKAKNKILGIVSGIIIFIAGTLVAFIGMVDYYGFGVLTVAVFYAFRGNRWWHKLGQFIGLYIINCNLLGGLMMDFTIGPMVFEIPQQGFALLAMVPILLYNGKQGMHNKGIQYGFYLFYPLHMLILSIIALCF